MSTSTAAIDLATRPLGRPGFTRGLIRLELRRLARNRRTLVFTLVFPVAMLLIVNGSIPAGQQSMGPGVIANVGAYLMVSMALYGVVMAATSGGAAVAVERASGWSRQLRLTPLSATSFILLKICIAIALSAVALGATFGAAAALDIPHLSPGSWAASALIILAGSFVFAAFGLFVGYLVPSENVMQFVGPILAVLGFLGGLFQGQVDTSTVMGQVQSYSPIYGLSQIAHWPLTLTTAGAHAAFDGWWVVNLLGWGLLFTAGAVWRFRQDTARV